VDDVVGDVVSSIESFDPDVRDGGQNWGVGAVGVTEIDVA
jgi:hypothetical protein